MKVVIALFVLIPAFAKAQQHVSSPNQEIKVAITGGNVLTVAATHKGRPILNPSQIGLSIGRVKANWILGKTTRVSADERIYPPVPEKRSVIRDHYNQLTIALKTDLSLQVRVYDDGFAYRFVSAFRDSITVEHETAVYSVPGNLFYGSPVNPRQDVDVFHTSFEEPYLVKPPDSISNDLLFFSPVMMAFQSGVKMVMTESDIEDYPGMFLRFNKDNHIEGIHAGYPISTRVNPGEFPAEVVTARAPFIARTGGKRTFPWRVFLVSNRDSELPSNDMVYRLASPPRVTDTKWIKPGQGTDEWIIGVNLFNVPFEAGVNTATYKYYIDFAKRFGFERIMMDAGWSLTTDLFKINPDIDMNEISAYAKAQGVSLSMWTLAHTLDRQLEPALEQFSKWGVDFIMTDFMDRDDQPMVNFYHRIARACAEHQIMVMFHGAFKPAGFNRTWPNAVTREGVLGSEYNIWSTKAHPHHNLLLPFIRMTAGPMDYEPGILDNATEKTFRPIGEKVMAMGTRMHQAAMFVVYESPIQIFAGNPSQGYLEPAFMELLGRIPTVWDETIVLDGIVGEYIVTARRKDNKWYVGAMSSWTERTLTIKLEFLGGGDYGATIAQDGVNANRYPSDYIISKQPVNSETTLEIPVARGGGFIIEIEKE